MVEFVKGLDYGIDLKYLSSQSSQEDTERNRQNLLSALDRMVAGDNGALWELFDRDVVFHEAECLPYGGAHHGIEAAKAAHATIYDYFDRIHIDLVS